jgi:hypothetical protein
MEEPPIRKRRASVHFHAVLVGNRGRKEGRKDGRKGERKKGRKTNKKRRLLKDGRKIVEGRK